MLREDGFKLSWAQCPVGSAHHQGCWKSGGESTLPGAVLENFHEGAPKEGFSDPALPSFSPEWVPSSVLCWQPQHTHLGSIGTPSFPSASPGTVLVPGILPDLEPLSSLSHMFRAHAQCWESVFYPQA